MGRFFTAYQTRIQPSGVVIEADGVTCSPPIPSVMAVLVAHLPGNLNQGNHSVYVDALDTNDRLLINPPGIKIGWTWEGRRDDEPAPLVALDKTSPMDTASGNITLGKGQVASVWLQDGDRVISNVVRGLSTAITNADPATGNSLYHNSFYVVFAARLDKPTSPPSPQPVTASVEVRLAQLEARLDVLEKSFRNLQHD